MNISSNIIPNLNFPAARRRWLPRAGRGAVSWLQVDHCLSPPSAGIFRHNRHPGPGHSDHPALDINTVKTTNPAPCVFLLWRMVKMPFMSDAIITKDWRTHGYVDTVLSLPMPGVRLRSDSCPETFSEDEPRQSSWKPSLHCLHCHRDC